MAVFFIILVSLVGVLGDYFLKLSGSGSDYINIKLFLLGTVIYSSTAVGWFLIMKHVKLSSLGLIYSITMVLSLTIVGTLFFKESLSTYEIVGLITGIVSIILLARFA